MRVLVTGADGFVGRHLVRRLLQAGDEVAAACRPGGRAVDWSSGAPGGSAVHVVALEMTEPVSVERALRWGPDAVIHLAAIASAQEAAQNAAATWSINAAGTALLVGAVASLRESGTSDPVVLLASSAEVYGAGGSEPRKETDPLLPQSTYAASKVGAEAAALGEWRRAGVRVVIARPFPHTGPGQSAQYVVPAFAKRLREARASGAATVPTGNLAPVRDLLDVRDVVEAYRALLISGTPGEIYNVSRGDGVALSEVFRRLSALLGVQAAPCPDPALVRRSDIPHLVGDSSKLRRATGWAPAITLEQTLRELVDAEAD